jgi:tetratricopeptide (TPR) repeat protein
VSETKDTEREPEEAEAGEAPPALAAEKKGARAGAEAIKDRNQRVRAEAAEKRRARRAKEQDSAPKVKNLDASEMMDDALARSTHAAAGFLRRHFNKMQWAIVIGLVAWIAWEVYAWRRERQAETHTAALFKALGAQTARVGEGEAAEDPRTGLVDARRRFGSEEERLNASLKEYKAAAAAIADDAMSAFAKLGEAGVLYDLGKYPEAQRAYEDVRQQKLYATDVELKGRTLEGLGMALEAQKKDEQALKAFSELKNMDQLGFSLLGHYHQARLLSAQGKADEAKQLLVKAGEKLVANKGKPGFNYITRSVLELYEGLDQTAARELGSKLMPSSPLDAMTGSSGEQKISPEKLKELMEQITKNAAPSQAPGSIPAEPEEPAPAEPAPAEPAPSVTP